GAPSSSPSASATSRRSPVPTPTPNPPPRPQETSHDPAHRPRRRHRRHHARLHARRLRPPGLAADHERYAAHCELLVDSGCRGVGPTGSLGEYSSLTDDERRRVVRTAVQAVGGRGLVVAGVHGVGSHQARHWAELAAEDGADAVLLLPPTLYRANRSEVIAHYAAVDEVGLPIMVYNNPIDTKVDLTPDLLAELAELENVVAVKEFSGDVRRVLEITELAPDLDVVAGADDLLFESLVAGAVGWFAG